jgi:hypothetical protein
MSPVSLRRRTALAAVGVGLFVTVLGVEAGPAGAATAKCPGQVSHGAHSRASARQPGPGERIQLTSDRQRHASPRHHGDKPNSAPHGRSNPKPKPEPKPRVNPLPPSTPVTSSVKPASRTTTHPTANAAKSPASKSATAAPTYVAAVVALPSPTAEPTNSSTTLPTPTASATAAAVATSPKAPSSTPSKAPAKAHRPEPAPLAIPGTPLRIGLFGGGVPGAVGASLAGVVLLAGAGSVLTLTRRGSR